MSLSLRRSEPAALNATQLAASPLFANLTDAALDRIASLAVVRDVVAKTLLFQQGDPGDALFAIITGRVDISVVGTSGRRLVLNVLGPGDVFGEIALLDGGERTASATTLARCHLGIIHRSHFLDLLNANPSIALAVMNVLCARLRWVSGQLEDRALLPVPARLAKRIMACADVATCKAKDTTMDCTDHSSVSAAGTVAMSQTDLADAIGATREHVNRVLTDWQNLGWVELGRGRLYVHDPAALRSLVDGTDSVPRT